MVARYVGNVHIPVAQSDIDTNQEIIIDTNQEIITLSVPF